MKKIKKRDKSTYWRAPPARTISLRIAETTYNSLVERAIAEKIHPTMLARSYIEKALGLERPGMTNRDWILWEKKDTDYY